MGGGEGGDRRTGGAMGGAGTRVGSGATGTAASATPAAGVRTEGDLGSEAVVAMGARLKGAVRAECATEKPAVRV